MDKTDQPSTTGDLRELMAWSMAAVMNGSISTKDADEIARLGKVYDQLFVYQTHFKERTGGKMMALEAVPTIAQLKQHIGADEFSAVIAEAKRIRELMKPILQHAKAQVDALKK
jgi:hypothetical protein